MGKIGTLFFLLLRLVWSAGVILIPVMGIWFSSSLTAFWNGPIWAVCLAGLLLFPILPLLWEALAIRRANKRDEKSRAAGRAVRERFLTFWDRLILRTLTMNMAFLTLMVATFPQAGFTALSTRGDWMLQSVEGDWVEEIRQGLFTGAGWLEWAYDAARENPFDDPDAVDKEKPQPDKLKAKKAAKGSSAGEGGGKTERGEGSTYVAHALGSAPRRRKNVDGYRDRYRRCRPPSQSKGERSFHVGQGAPRLDGRPDLV